MTGPDVTLAARAEAVRAALADAKVSDPEDRLAVARERGWLEAVAHLARHAGLSHAGRVEAEQMIAASDDWLRDRTVEDPPPARGR